MDHTKYNMNTVSVKNKATNNERRMITLLKLLLVGAILLTNFHTHAQKLDRVEPAFWWVGMQHDELQLLVYGKNIREAQPEINYTGVELVEVHQAESANYLFLDLKISPSANAGTFPIIFRRGRKEVARYEYTLKERDKRSPAQIDGSDVIYLITPDRFKNGDSANDDVKGMKEKSNRQDKDGRHGGDLAGVISAIDYMHGLGITAVWLNPVLENNMESTSYHGYSTTDYYKVDPRYGSNEQYRQLVDELHKKDMKLIMDMIFNHCGLEHWWMKDLPFKDWINDYPDYDVTNHAIGAVSDPYAAVVDLNLLTRGWFVPSMPDLNHNNPFMANYLIQNSIWWIEYAALDGIRMDTYPYNNKEMMVEWVERVNKEYPDFFLLGETWVGDPATEAFWAGKAPDDKTYNTQLYSITDFPLCYAIHNAFRPEGNVQALYDGLSKDFLYYTPALNTIFADNHDMDRFYYTIEKDLNKFKNAMTFLLTTRGIPQLYYGTEILMEKFGPHGDLREDFPGGWAEDTRNAFTSIGRTEKENEAFDYLEKLLNWRKSSKAVHSGSLKHFTPHDNVYVYNRKSADESVLVIINNKSENAKMDMTRYQEVLKGFTSAVDVISGRVLESLENIEIEGNSSLVLELK